MMSFIFNIGTVARYEMKALFRSWFLRIFMLLALIVLFFYDLATLTDIDGSATWNLIADAARIPYFNLWLLNIGQAIVAVFLASDFLKRDKKLDTSEVVYTKPVSNTEYILGKITGNLLVFLIVDMVMLFMLAIFNVLSPEADLDVAAYFQYLLLLVIPSLFFILGLTFFLMSLVRNQAVTFIILLSYIAMVIFYLKDKMFYLFDYMAFRYPMLKSEIVGFINLQELMLQRGIYLLLGLGFIFFSVILLKRLPHSKREVLVAGTLGLVSILSASYFIYDHIERTICKKQTKAQLLALNDEYANRNKISILSNDLDLKHNGITLAVTSRMLLRNPGVNRMDTLVFSLNPGLRVKHVLQKDKPVSYQRKLHLLLVPLKKPLLSGDTIRLKVVYSGIINEDICYPDIPEEEKHLNANYLYPVSYGFVTPRFVLLTPELLWYPVSGTTYSPSHAGWLKRDFTRFRLRVQTSPGLVSVSEGLVPDTTGNNQDFMPDHPLLQLSLAIGEFDKRSLRVDSIDFNVYAVKGHAYFVNALPELKDTVDDILRESLHDYERKLNLKYPFHTFSLVEVPVQFTARQHLWTGTMETVQPGIVFFPEKGVTVSQADLKGQYKRYKKWSRWSKEKKTDKEFQIEALRNFFNVFTKEGGVQWKGGIGKEKISETVNAFNIFSNFYNYRNFLESWQWPIINKVLEVYLRSPVAGTGNTWLRRYTGLSEDEKANIALQKKSFAELLPDPKQRQIIDNVISLKGELLFSVMKSKTRGELFDDFLYRWLNENQFRVTEFSAFSAAVKKHVGLDMAPYMHEWFYGKKLPGFLFGKPELFRVKEGNYMKNRVVLVISDPEETEGVVKLIFRLHDPDNPDQSNDENRLVFLDKKQTKRVSYLFDKDPRSVRYYTFSSKNIPLVIDASFPKAVVKPTMAPFEGEEIVSPDALGIYHPNEIIVDNEDPEFSVTEPETQGFLFKWLAKPNETGEKYSGFNWRAPVNWTLTTYEAFYGKYVRSAMFVRSGNGNRKAFWKIPVKKAGFYDVYYYLDYRKYRWKRHNEGEYQFVIHHNRQVDKPVLNLKKSEAGWNNLGSYFFSSDTGVIELSNKSKARIVVADAVKLVR